MTAWPPSRLLGIYAAAFSVYIVYASLATLVATHSGGGHHGTAFIAVLAGLEIIAALGFAFRRTRQASGLMLLVTFCVASAATVAGGDVPAHLAIYAVTVGFVLLLDRSLPREAGLG